MPGKQADKHVAGGAPPPHLLPPQTHVSQTHVQHARGMDQHSRRDIEQDSEEHEAIAAQVVERCTSTPASNALTSATNGMRTNATSKRSWSKGKLTKGSSPPLPPTKVFECVLSMCRL